MHKAKRISAEPLLKTIDCGTREGVVVVVVVVVGGGGGG